MQIQKFAIKISYLKKLDKKSKKQYIKINRKTKNWLFTGNKNSLNN